MKNQEIKINSIRVLLGLELYYWFMVSKQLCGFAFFFPHFSNNSHKKEYQRGGESDCWNTNTNRLGKKETDDRLLSG